MVIPLLHSALNDEAVWGDPHCFRPERFLDDSGALVKKEQFIPFSVGQCFLGLPCLAGSRFCLFGFSVIVVMFLWSPLPL